jgi:sulfate adenylyltransferase
MLSNLYVTKDQVAELRRRLADLPRLDLDQRQICDLELLLNGSFSPLTGFMTEADYVCVLEQLRLTTGTLWPMPITLDISESAASRLSVGQDVVLCDAHGIDLAILSVSDIFKADKNHEAQHVFGTRDRAHAGVAELFGRGNIYLGGRLQGLREPLHNDFADLRYSPQQLRQWFERQGWERIVGFQTRNPMHRAHVELTRRAMESVDGKLLLHPAVGKTKAGDIDIYTRVKCYRELLSRYARGEVKLSVLPLAMRMAGPREALWHAIIRKNYGVSHFIVGRDHAGPGKDASGKSFYQPREAQELLETHRRELGIEVVAFPSMVYAPRLDRYVPQDDLSKDEPVADVSGTQLRQHLREGTSIPDWFTYPEIETVLRKRYPLGARKGAAILLTGLSGAGKSTIAQALKARIHEDYGRDVTLLDGDEVRKALSAGLGYSRQDRSANVLRIAFVASEVVKHGGIAICAPIAPYAEDRVRARELVQEHGEFVEVHVSTSLEVCEERDCKGLYAMARAGVLDNFTGISDPYEIPENPDLRLESSEVHPSELASRIIVELKNRCILF